MIQAEQSRNPGSKLQAVEPGFPKTDVGDEQTLCTDLHIPEVLLFVSIVSFLSFWGKLTSNRVIARNI